MSVGRLRCLWVLAVLAGCGEVRYVERTEWLMDSYCTVRVPERDRRVLDEVFRRMREVERSLDRHRPGGLARLNAGEVTVLTDLHVAECFRVADAVRRASGGAFDATVAVFLDLWGFGSGRPRVPSAGELVRARRWGGMGDFRAVGDRLERLRGGAVLDFGGLGQGYAVRKAVEVLRGRGVRSALVDCSGDIYALGRHGERPWRIAVRDPADRGRYVAVLELEDRAVVTSGSYERGFTNGGVWYHHLLDPRTGRPARGVVSVTVVAEDAAEADAWSTAYFVMGEGAVGMAEAGVGPGAVLVVREDGKMEMTAAMRRYVVAVQPSQ